MRGKMRSLMMTKRELQFPVSRDIARERIKSAFANNITVSKGFLSSTIEYEGEINDDNFEVNYTSRGRNTASYHMNGTLYTDAHGSRLEMTIQDRYPWRVFFAPLFALVICVVFSIVSGLKSSGLSSLIILFGGVFFAIILGVISFAMASWTRSVAVNSIETLVNNIVLGRQIS